MVYCNGFLDSLCHSPQYRQRKKLSFSFTLSDSCSLSKSMIYEKANLSKSFHFSTFLLWFKDVISEIETHKLPPGLNPLEICNLSDAFAFRWLEADYLCSLPEIKVGWPVIFRLRGFFWTMTMFGFFQSWNVTYLTGLLENNLQWFRGYLGYFLKYCRVSSQGSGELKTWILSQYL